MTQALQSILHWLKIALNNIIIVYHLHQFN